MNFDRLNQLDADDLSLVAAAINFANHCKPMLQDHLQFQGHSDLAERAEKLDELRQLFCDLSHEKRDEEWESKSERE